MDLIKEFFIFLLSLFSLSPQTPTPSPAPTPYPTVIQISGLPDHHLIQTAFIAQAPEKNWDQPWQDACEEAALLTADFYYRQSTPSAGQQKEAILAMLGYETGQGWSHDVTLDQMAQIASDYLGYKTQIITDPTIQIIKETLLKNIPVIIPANGKTLFKENRHFKSGGPWYHNLVILGFDQAKKLFIVHDVGTQFGPYFPYSYQTLLDSIHDFPASGRKEDIDTGPKKILLLLK